MNSCRIIASRIADGSSFDTFPGRVTVQLDRIMAVEQGFFLPETPADRVLADDEILCPAFIDSHGHSDISILAMPQAEGKTAQGIGTEIAGNCGLSAYPLTDKNRDHLQSLYAQYQIKLDWDDLAGYQKRLKTAAPALDVIPLVGHNTLRAAVAGYECKKLSSAQLQEMQTLLDAQFRAGAKGLSSGLLYVPGCFADFEELCALLQVVAQYDLIYTVHLRSESADLEAAVEETLQAARAAGLKKLHLSHLKTARPENFHKLPVLLEALQSKDLRVTGDIYCFDAAMTQLSVILPSPYDEMDDISLQTLLRDENEYRRALKALQTSRSSDYWARVRLVSAKGFEEFAGKLIPEIAENLRLAPAETVLNIVRTDAPGATGAFHTLSRKNMELLAQHPNVVPGSDESARNTTLKFGSSHPRGFGNMPEYFQLRRTQGAAIGQIIAEMSGIPAGIFGLHDRGTITPGKLARFVVIIPEAYSNNATFARPHTLAAGAKLWQ